jgi:hypothetical protein
MNNKPRIMNNQRGIVTNCMIPKWLAIAQSLAFTIKSAKVKLMMMVVMVNNILRDACFNLLYRKLNKGIKLSMIQKKLMPPAKIKALWRLGICSK